MCIALIMSACGSTATTTGAAASSTSTPTVVAATTGTPATPGSAQLNGCLSEQPPSAASTPADVVASTSGSLDAAPVSLHVGQVVEIPLSAASRWTLHEQGATTSLTPISPNGWYRSTSPAACVWRFTAAQAGTVMLQFGGIPVCAAGTVCSNLARVITITIQVA